jgi:uncharacterized protein (TIGR00369 family)
MNEMSQISEHVVDAITGDQGILDAFGMKVVSAIEGQCDIHCQVPHSLVNAGGFAHGSIAFSLIDTAAAYAIRSTGSQGVTSTANITYVKGAVGGDSLEARVVVLSQTRRVASLRGEVYLLTNGERVLAAHGSLVFQLRAKS